jgi:hypothetical protein
MSSMLRNLNGGAMNRIERALQLRPESGRCDPNCFSPPLDANSELGGALVTLGRGPITWPTILTDCMCGGAAKRLSR